MCTIKDITCKFQCYSSLIRYSDSINSTRFSKYCVVNRQIIFDQLLNTRRVSFLIHNTCKYDGPALFEFRASEKHRYKRRLGIRSASPKEKTRVNSYWYLSWNG